MTDSNKTYDGRNRLNQNHHLAAGPITFTKDDTDNQPMKRLKVDPKMAGSSFVNDGRSVRFDLACLPTFGTTIHDDISRAEIYDKTDKHVSDLLRVHAPSRLQSAPSTQTNINIGDEKKENATCVNNGNYTNVNGHQPSIPRSYSEQEKKLKRERARFRRRQKKGQLPPKSSINLGNGSGGESVWTKRFRQHDGPILARFYTQNLKPDERDITMNRKSNMSVQLPWYRLP